MNPININPNLLSQGFEEGCYEVEERNMKRNKEQIISYDNIKSLKSEQIITERIFNYISGGVN